MDSQGWHPLGAMHFGSRMSEAGAHSVKATALSFCPISAGLPMPRPDKILALKLPTIQIRQEGPLWQTGLFGIPAHHLKPQCRLKN